MTFFCDLEQKIDGRRFLQLTDDDIPQLLTRSTLGDQIRFRIKLNQLKEKNPEEQRSSTVISEVIELVPRKEEKAHLPIDAIQQYHYRIEEKKHLLFFEKANFVNHLFHFVKRETIPTLNIQLIRKQSIFIIQFTGTKSEIRIVRDCLRQLLKSIETKEYRHSLGKNLSMSRILQSVFFFDILSKTIDMFSNCKQDDSTFL